MKKIILLAVVAIVAMSAKAQENFTGIGIFKIGSDTSLVYEYAKANKAKVKAANDDYKYMEGTTLATKLTILRLYQNPKEVTPIMKLSICPDVVEYSLSSYSISGITLKKVRLLYYKNKLNKFSCDYNSEAMDAVELKYGKIPVKIKDDTVTCVYNLTGHERKLLSHTITQIKDFDNITFRTLLWTGYDEHCNDIANALFEYEIKNEDLSECIIQNTHDATPKITKDKLKDF